MHTDDATTTLAMAVWGEQLQHLTDEQIDMALKALPSKHPSWPPTLGEFMAMAKGETNRFVDEQRAMFAELGVAL